MMILSARELVVGYGVTSLNYPIDLDVYAGDLVQIVGPNGSGKTTLLRTLLGVNAHLAGRLRRGIAWRMGLQVGYVPQDAQSTLLDWFDAHQNILLGLLNGSAAAPSQDLVELMARFSRFSRGERLRDESQDVAKTLSSLKRRLGRSWRSRKVSELSGGERQKVAIMRSLIPSPVVLFLDEPFQELDLDSALALAGYLELYSQSKRGAVIYVSHQEVGLSKKRVVTMGL